MSFVRSLIFLLFCFDDVCFAVCISKLKSIATWSERAVLLLCSDVVYFQVLHAKYFFLSHYFFLNFWWLSISVEVFFMYVFWLLNNTSSDLFVFFVVLV